MENPGKWEQNTVLNSISFWIPAGTNIHKVFAEVYTNYCGGKESYEIRFFDSRVPKVHVSYIRSAERAKEIVEEQYQKAQEVKEPPQPCDKGNLKGTLSRVLCAYGINDDFGIPEEDIAEYLLTQLESLRATMKIIKNG